MKKMKSGRWHGRDGRDVTAVLIGSYTEAEARKISKLLDEDGTGITGEPWYNDVVYVEDPDEWNEQNG